MDDTLRLRLDIAYDGTNFHGWARQPGLDSVQGALEDGLERILRRPVRTVVAGRTDAGVHASGQVAHADIPKDSLNQRSIEGDPGRLVRRLAKLLPEDVRVFDVTQAPAGFDARFSALTRTYCYRVTTHPAGAVPTRARDTAVWPKPVDLGAVQACADALVGLNNFAAFCRPKEHGTTIREVHSFTWHEVEPRLYEARITADAFCWNMVRALVATCLTVGEGRRAPEWPEELLLLDARAPDVPLAPARGLTLVGVDYPADSDLAARAEATRAMREM